jgi:beta-galactosidase
MIKLKYIIMAFLLVCVEQSSAIVPPDTNKREIIALNDSWEFHFAYNIDKPLKTIVNLPHTWDAADVTKGIVNYDRETGIYEKSIIITKNKQNKRLFLYFEGANSVATVFVNHHYAGEHHGGYTAFCLEITDFIKVGAENEITVQVSNAYRPDVLPLTGDFNVYGGLHRQVSLLVTSKNCISPLDYASPGVYILQKDVSSKTAQINVLTKLSLQNGDSLAVKTTILDQHKNVVATITTPLSKNNINSISQHIIINAPHLWNGVADPYLYQAHVELLYKGVVIDEVAQPLGLRYFNVDANKGFFLNGKYLDLHGLGLHEDFAGKGSALTKDDEHTDMELVKEIGATALRLTHYPHQQYFYNLCDSSGIVVWSEIPLVGPGGYSGYGYIKSKALQQQAIQVLTEMIRQNFNHPSVCFWGLFNELKLDYDNPIPFLDTLNTIAKNEDPSRLTTCATFLDKDTFNRVSDVIAWNKYYGWYGSSFEQLGIWADRTHKMYPDKPFAISEYGAGGSPYQHMENVTKPVSVGRFHPEEWETLFHEENWRQLVNRPFLWGKFVWSLADFGSSIRKEGLINGMNDKGLVTYDRRVKKDAFYFYKANWSNEPVLYITGRRNNKRTQPVTPITIFANMKNAELIVNGKSCGKMQADALHMITWKNIRLKKGNNEILVKAKIGNNTLHDSCEWQLL